ncbi:hypothetical protein [Dactylosporangium sp. CA-092794]|uniref:hypothetical protein n=1 Tax=Dactylosporangium sp. CA-092794 TaxID=3239929 RepID=UPI003D8D0F13
MIRRHTKVLHRPDEDGYRPRHARDSHNTLNDADHRDEPGADSPPAPDSPSTDPNS